MSPPALAFSSANHAASLRSKELSLAGARDEPLVGCTRAFLALAALAIIYIEPSEPSRLVGLTYISLAAYCAWSLLQLHPRIGGSIGGSPWVDVAWATYLVALTQGTSSIFFFLYVFAILVASFSGGYRRGLQIAITSAILFTIVGLIAAPSGPEFELDRSLIRPIYLLTIGSMMAVWGGRAIARRERLVLLRDIAGDWKPRTGVSGTVLANLTRLRRFYGARECLLVTRPGSEGPTTVYRAGPGDRATDVMEIDAATAALFLHSGASQAWRLGGPLQHRGAAATDLLEGAFGLDVPYRQANGTEGRLLLTRDGGAFRGEDIEFAAQVAMALAHVVENTQLIEEMFVKAAEHERFRISLDIHDSTVQPYIGLRLGIDALHRSAVGSPFEQRLKDLLTMADTTIGDLRGFATGIRQRAPISGESLRHALLEQADRFRRFYGIEVTVECDATLFVSPHVASEAFRMASEGLSNVMRHTAARTAGVRLERRTRELHLQITNGPWPSEAAEQRFSPASIQSRANALRGTTHVEQHGNGATTVQVSIPV